MSLLSRSATSVSRRDGGQQIGKADLVDDDELGVRLLGAGAGLVREGMPGEHQAGPGVAEVVGDLPRLEQRVHRDDDPARAKDAVVHDGDLGDVGHHDPDPVAGPETSLVQQAGDPGARLIERPVGHRRVVHPHGHPSGVDTSGVRQVLRQVRHAVIVGSPASPVVGPRYQAWGGVVGTAAQSRVPVAARLGTSCDLSLRRTLRCR